MNFNQINIDDLPKKRRMIIKYALDHPDKVILMRIEELAKHLNVDPTTIVKACKAVGLNGYLELKQLLKKDAQLTNVDSIFGGFITNMELPTTPQQIARDSILSEIIMLKKTYEELDFEMVETISKKIIEAKRVVIIGLGHFSLVANFLERTLRSVLPNVMASTEYHGELYSAMAHFSKEDVIIGICLDKCQHQTLESMKFAKEERGATTVALVDSNNSPLLAHSDYQLVIKGVDAKYMDNMLGAVSLSNALFYCVAEMVQERTIEHYKFFREMSEKNNTYHS